MSSTFALDAQPYADIQLIDRQDIFEKTKMNVTTEESVPFAKPRHCMRADITFIEGNDQTPPLVGTVLVDTSQLFYTACLIFEGGDPRVADVINQGLWKDHISQFPCAEQMPDDFAIAEPYSPVYTFISESDKEGFTHPALYAAIQPEEIDNGPIDEVPLAIAMATYDLATPVMFMDAKGEADNVRISLSLNFTYSSNPVPAIKSPTLNRIMNAPRIPALEIVSDYSRYNFGESYYKGNYGKITYDV